MKIKKLVVENIKSFKDKTEINLSENLNIFVGPNGGGKSNLLDIITITLRHFFVQFYSVSRGQEAWGWFEDIGKPNLFNPINNFLEKYLGNEINTSFIEITFIISKEDIKNINLLKSNKEKLENALRDYRNRPISNFKFLDSWNTEDISENKELTFTIQDLNLITPTDVPSKILLEYLNYYELFLILGSKIIDFWLNPPFIYFSPYRLFSQTNLLANLSGLNFNESMLRYFQSTSKSTATLIDLSLYRVAEKRRNYELEGGDYHKRFKQDNEILLLTNYFNKLGYNWDVECVDPMRNLYEVMIERSGKKFSIVQASSGEKEILNFLLGIFAFNIKDGLVIIDEPELHLHPKWQTILIDLFQELSRTHKNQFVIVSHSPVFINERTIENLFRVYRDNEISKLIQPEQSFLPTVKDLLHIVNTLNNEKIFFADKVMLVEGISDRLIFQRLIEKYHKSETIIEVLEVHGKDNLVKYRNFLELFKIKNYIVADLDYVTDIGDSNIKNMLDVDNIKIEDDVVLNKKSKDGKNLMALFREIIAKLKKGEKVEGTETFMSLNKFLEYVESRYRKLKDDLSEADKQLLYEFIDSKKSKSIFILKYGEIEDYFPEISKNRSLESIVEFITTEKLDRWYEKAEKDDMRKDLELIISKIMSGEK